MKIHSELFIVISLLFLTSCTNNISMDRNISDLNKRLDKYLALQLQEDQFPGVQYIVFDNNKILYEYADGFAKIEANERMHPNSLLNVFSTTKILTAISILQLVEDKKLSLDDKIEKHLPDVPYKDITILDVLSHSSGIPNPFLGNFFIHWSNEHDDFDRDALLITIMEENKELKFKSGEKILYSNLGYAILGKIIENVSNLRYEDYVIKYIINRLKLDKQEINFGDQTQSRAARPYFKRFSLIYNIMVMLLKGNETKVEGKWKAIDKSFYFNFPSHGGIMASSREYSKIFMDLLDDKSVLLSPESINTLFTLQRHYDDKSIAISWFKGEMQGKGLPYFYHQGGGMGYVAEVRIYPEMGIGSLILMNRTEVDTLSILNALDSEYILNMQTKN